MIVTFDVTNAESLTNVAKWHEEIEKTRFRTCCKMAYWKQNRFTWPSALPIFSLFPHFLQRVTETEAREVAKKYGMQYTETSAKTGTNVEETFIAVTKAMLVAQRL